MKQLLRISIVICLQLVLLPTAIFAQSQSHYQSYLTQYDSYRKALSSFQIAKNEYDKFKTLQAQAQALTTAKTLLIERNKTLRQYIELLQNLIRETPHMATEEASTLNTLLENEKAFLTTHEKFVASISTVADANTASKQLESHNQIVLATFRQTTLSILIARTNVYAIQYEVLLTQAKSLIEEVKKEFPVEKHAVIDRWYEQMSNKRTLYQQKSSSVANAVSTIKGNPTDQIKVYQEQVRQLSLARQELIEGSRYMGELISVIRFID